jgi:hypothetical protein
MIHAVIAYIQKTSMYIMLFKWTTNTHAGYVIVFTLNQCSYRQRVVIPDILQL